MKFNLGRTQSVSSQGNSNQLGVGIHDVKFVGVTQEVIEKKDKSATFNVLKVKFDGIGESAGKGYTHTIFEPRPGDDVRKKNNFDYENPAASEELEFLVQHLLAAVAPVTSKQIADKGEIEVTGFDSLGKFILKATAKAGGVETQIKLVPNKENQGVFPSFVLGISKKGEAYPRTNFIGKGLTFTANEVKQIEAKASAQPSKMPALDKAIDSIDTKLTDDELDLDIESI